MGFGVFVGFGVAVLFGAMVTVEFPEELDVTKCSGAEVGIAVAELIASPETFGV